MAVVEMLTEGDRTIPKPDWASVADAIGRVASGQSMTLLLEGSDDAWLSVSNAEGYGVQVMAIEDGELGEKVLTDPSLEGGLVAVRMGGLPQQEARLTLVAASLALDVARHFLETGKRSPEAIWRDPFEVEREAIGSQ